MAIQALLGIVGLGVGLFGAAEASAAADEAARMQALAIMKADKRRSDAMRYRAEYNDQESRLQAHQVRNRGRLAIGMRDREALDMISAQRVALASNGLSVGYGSAGALQMQENRIAQFETTVMRESMLTQVSAIERANRWEQEAVRRDIVFGGEQAQSQIAAINAAASAQSTASIINGVSGAIDSISSIYRGLQGD